jgi:predicted transcriptional regulator
MVPELKLLNMPVNGLHRDVDQTMQDILKQLDNISTRLKTKLHETETELEESEKTERSALELKNAAIEEYSNAARRVEELDIAKLKEVIKQEKQKQKLIQ